jgi:hypothetical protein
MKRLSDVMSHNDDGELAYICGGLLDTIRIFQITFRAVLVLIVHLRS